MKTDSRTEDLLAQLLRLTAAQVVNGKTLTEGASLLDRLGVGRDTIAAVYATSEGSVRAAISQSKADKPSKAKRGGKSAGPA